MRRVHVQVVQVLKGQNTHVKSVCVNEGKSFSLCAHVGPILTVRFAARNVQQVRFVSVKVERSGWRGSRVGVGRVRGRGGRGVFRVGGGVSGSVMSSPMWKVPHNLAPTHVDIALNSASLEKSRARLFFCARIPTVAHCSCVCDTQCACTAADKRNAAANLAPYIPLPCLLGFVDSGPLCAVLSQTSGRAWPRRQRTPSFHPRPRQHPPGKPSTHTGQASTQRSTQCMKVMLVNKN